MTPSDRDTDPEGDAVATTADDGARSAEGPDDHEHGDHEHGDRRRQLPLWQETVLLLGVAVVLAVVIKALFLQAFYIPSESMEPGLVRNDRILVQKPSYWGGGSPERGDVVVFEDPGTWLQGGRGTGPSNPLASGLAAIGLYPTGGHLVKRVVGTEGDVITCCDREGRISVNGTPIDESAYVKDDPASPCNGPMLADCDWTAGPVPEDHVFVMGDNRNNSADSTVHMCREDATDCVPGREFVPTDLVVGKVFLLAWPLSNLELLDHPDSFAEVPEPSEPAPEPAPDATRGAGPEAGAPGG